MSLLLAVQWSCKTAGTYPRRSGSARISSDVTASIVLEKERRDFVVVVIVVVGRIRLQCPLDKQLKEERHSHADGQTGGHTDRRMKDGRQTDIRATSMEERYGVRTAEAESRSGRAMSRLRSGCSVASRMTTPAVAR